ncbi:DNA helicase [Arthrobacter phage Ottawa]|nr:DNA helicase [Arthrobacter phage Kharcho]WIC89293.1 DNA helicase [Arthrobacter phage Ottawa]
MTAGPPSITADGETFRLTFEHNPDILRDLVRIPGRRHDFDSGIWTVPVAFAEPVRHFASRHGFQMDRTASPFLKPPAPGLVDHDGHSFLLSFPYTERNLQGVARIEGAEWDATEAAWGVPTEQVRAVQAFMGTMPHTVAPGAEEAYEAAERFEQAVIASAALDHPYTPRPGFGIELDPHQRAGVHYALTYAGGRLVIGDEPGVGKTAQAMAILHALDAFPAYVIPPSKAKINWAREIQRALPGRSVEVLRGTRGQDRLMWSDVTIMNYEILEAWENFLPAPRGVVADESHNIMNPSAIRTKAVQRLMERVPEGGVAVCMTGTPSLNATSDFIPQLKAIGKLDDLGGEEGFRKLARTSPTKAHRLMRGTCYVRRTKEAVFPNGPARNFEPLLVEGDPKIMAEYRRAEADIIKYLAAKAEAAAEASGATSEEAKLEAWKATLMAGSAEQLMAFNHLRQLSAAAKMGAAEQWSKDFLRSGRKLGIFGWHKPTINTIAQKLNAPKIQGGQSDEESQRSVDRFQNDPNTKAIALQLKAAGVAITLTAASDALFIEQGWNPGTMDQALDRFHRRGQVRDVLGRVMIIPGTIDEDMDRIIKLKRETVNAITDGKDPEETGGSVLQDLVVTFAQRGLKGAI